MENEPEPISVRQTASAVLATLSMIAGFCLIGAIGYRRLVQGILLGGLDKILIAGAFYLFIRGALFWRKRELARMEKDRTPPSDP